LGTTVAQGDVQCPAGRTATTGLTCHADGWRMPGSMGAVRTHVCKMDVPLAARVELGCATLWVYPTADGMRVQYQWNKNMVTTTTQNVANPKYQTVVPEGAEFLGTYYWVKTQTEKTEAAAVWTCEPASTKTQFLVSDPVHGKTIYKDAVFDYTTLDALLTTINSNFGTHFALMSKAKLDVWYNSNFSTANPGKQLRIMSSEVCTSLQPQFHDTQSGLVVTITGANQVEIALAGARPDARTYDVHDGVEGIDVLKRKVGKKSWLRTCAKFVPSSGCTKTLPATRWAAKELDMLYWKNHLTAIQTPDSFGYLPISTGDGATFNQVFYQSGDLDARVGLMEFECFEHLDDAGNTIFDLVHKQGMPSPIRCQNHPGACT